MSCGRYVGGVDSSEAAALLRDQWDEVMGLWLQFLDAAAKDTEQATCSGRAGMEEARRVAVWLEPFSMCSITGRFSREIIDPFGRLKNEARRPILISS